MRPSEQREWSDKRCEFYKEQGRYTNDCVHLRNFIESTIRIGQLERLVVSSCKNHENQGRNDHEASGSRSQARDKNKQIFICTIHVRIGTNEEWL
ncbi:hypothetical protein V6N13_081210 [Hibiscus sabdariffa]|uniref:Uncharacterized protein n=1 Tax=Hibiscus sabdariffa TaxID=183260 RepID=A0ABR2P9E5_9ROSI